MSYQPPPPPPGYGYQQQPPPPGYGYQPQAAQGAYANWGQRVASALIDGVITSAPIFVTYIIAIAIAAASQSASGGTTTGITGLGAFLVVVGYLAGLGLAIWNVFIRQGTTGQSLGKQALGTRLVSLQTGQPIGAGLAFVRQICHFLDSLPCYVGYLWPLWDEKRQTFADKIVGTVVVRTA